VAAILEGIHGLLLFLPVSQLNSLRCGEITSLQNYLHGSKPLSGIAQTFSFFNQLGDQLLPAPRARFFYPVFYLRAIP
jgi:hypothetical protein